MGARRVPVLAPQSTDEIFRGRRVMRRMTGDDCQCLGRRLCRTARSVLRLAPPPPPRFR
jgi:hypothetical protein